MDNKENMPLSDYEKIGLEIQNFKNVIRTEMIEPVCLPVMNFLVKLFGFMSSK